MSLSRLPFLFCFFLVLGCDQLEKKPSPVVNPIKEAPLLNPLVNPIKLVSGKKVVSLSLGEDHSCILYDDQSLECWGSNQFGQLGKPPTELQSSATPVLVHPDLKFVAIAAGRGNTCGILEEGTVWCWGSNEYQELGITAKGKAFDQVPNQIFLAENNPLQKATAISSRFNRVCVKNDADIFCWGKAHYAATEKANEAATETSHQFKNLSIDEMAVPHFLNHNDKEEDKYGPRWTPLNVDFQKLVFLEFDTCTVISDRIRCLNSVVDVQGVSQLAGTQSMLVVVNPAMNEVSCIETKSRTRSEELPLTTHECTSQGLPAGSIERVFAGYRHSCISYRDGDTMCFGNNDYVQLATQEKDLSKNYYVGINQSIGGVAGGNHSCALAKDGNQLYCWGDNRAQQCGKKPL